MLAPSRTPRLDALIRRLAITIVVLSFAISPMALNALGWNYDGNGGAGPTRFHLVTYLAVATVLLVLLRAGNPLTGLGRAFGHDARLCLFLTVWLIVFVHGVVNQGLPAATLVDTFLLPVLVLVILRQLDSLTLKRMAWLFHLGFAINALLGIGEFVTATRLTPYIAGGVLITEDWRSTALLGHPLGNALMTGCYTVILLVGGGRELVGGRRLAQIVLQFGGMVAFGGRASLVLLVLFGAVAAARTGGSVLAGRRVDLRHVLAIAIVAPLMIAALALLFDSGFFDRLILRFLEDNGSAEARVVMFELFRYFTWPELLLGPSQDNLAYYVRIYRLEFGIESLWIAFSLYYGILPAALFFVALLGFLATLVESCARRAWLVFGYFFVINSTFLGIAGKTITFSTLCMMIVLLLPAVRVPSAQGRLSRAGGAPAGQVLAC